MIEAHPPLVNIEGNALPPFVNTEWFIATWLSSCNIASFGPAKCQYLLKCGTVSSGDWLGRTYFNHHGTVLRQHLPHGIRDAATGPTKSKATRKLPRRSGNGYSI